MATDKPQTPGPDSVPKPVDGDDVRGAPSQPLPAGPDVQPGAGQEAAENEEAPRHEDWGKR